MHVSQIKPEREHMVRTLARTIVTMVRVSVAGNGMRPDEGVAALELATVQAIHDMLGCAVFEANLREFADHLVRHADRTEQCKHVTHQGVGHA